jgi:hypothetical protein
MLQDPEHLLAGCRVAGGLVVAVRPPGPVLPGCGALGCVGTLAGAGVPDYLHSKNSVSGLNCPVCFVWSSAGQCGD